MSALAAVLGIDLSIPQQIAKEFVGIPFRQQVVARAKGVTYINDTTATTPTAAIKALQSATSPTIWITGGDTKNLPYDELIKEVQSNPHLKNIVILGSKNIPTYTEALSQSAPAKILGTAMNMAEALALAGSVAKEGDAILLSPGFSSFDLFQNEFDRGRQFNEIVQDLASRT